jgi:hypothetical protein
MSNNPGPRPKINYLEDYRPGLPAALASSSGALTKEALEASQVNKSSAAEQGSDAKDKGKKVDGMIIAGSDVAEHGSIAGPERGKPTALPIKAWVTTKVTKGGEGSKDEGKGNVVIAKVVSTRSEGEGGSSK